MPSTEYYRILDVPPDADREAIRAAFRREVKRVHPDAQADESDDGLRLKALLQAYEALMEERLPPPPFEDTPYRQTHAEDAAERTFRAAAPRWPSGPAWDLDRQLDALPLSELCHCLSAWQDRHGRAAVAHALSRRRSPTAMRALLQALDVETDRNLRVELIRSLGQSRSRRAIHPLARLLDDADPRIASAARVALHKIAPIASRGMLYRPHGPLSLLHLHPHFRR